MYGKQTRRKQYSDQLMEITLKFYQKEVQRNTWEQDSAKQKRDLEPNSSDQQ